MNRCPVDLRIALLGPASSPHIQRWANGLAERGCRVTVYTQHFAESRGSYEIRRLPFSGNLGYFLNALFLRKMLKRDGYDVFHAHYLSGYATTARLSGIRPFVVSVWGSDIFSFPKEGALQRRLITKNLRAAKWVLSTSLVMAKEIRKYAVGSLDVRITPFGVDSNEFSPGRTGDERIFTVGMIKNLEVSCGGDLLIRAIHHLRNTDKGDSGIRLLIAGDGPERRSYEDLAAHLGISDRVAFLGRLEHHEVPGFMRGLDVYCAPSRAESFGVALLEAQAAGIPVVAANVGGIPEVVMEGETAFLFQPGNYEEMASRVLELRNDPSLRRRMGTRGRKYVLAKYSWPSCVGTMLAVYNEVVDTSKGAHR